MSELATPINREFESQDSCTASLFLREDLEGRGREGRGKERREGGRKREGRGEERWRGRRKREGRGKRDKRDEEGGKGWKGQSNLFFTFFRHEISQIWPELLLSQHSP